MTAWNHKLKTIGLFLFSDLFFISYRTLALIKPDAVPKAGEIIEMINKSGFTITKLRMMTLSR